MRGSQSLILLSMGLSLGQSLSVNHPRAAANVPKTAARVVSHLGPDLPQEPTIQRQGTSSKISPHRFLVATPTKDGLCGAANGYTTCAGWSAGTCCSMYGFCGSSSAHCGDGCQSGPCSGAAVNPVPAAKPVSGAGGGSIQILPQTQYKGQNVGSGVPVMHAGLLPNGRVFFLDKIENYTQLRLPNGQYAYSAEYDPQTHQVVPLSYKTNAFCSGGGFLPKGTVLSIGGNADLNWLDPTVGSGFNGIRSLWRQPDQPGLNGQGWTEIDNRKLKSDRWYPSVLGLGDGTQFVVSGSKNGLDPVKPENNNPTFEFLDSSGMPIGPAPQQMSMLVKNQPYYMYPFLHLLNDGRIFNSVAKSAQLYRITNYKGYIDRQFPDIPGSFRTYPNTGTSVLLPLSSSNGYAPEVLICGGGGYQDIDSPTDASCGRIAPLEANSIWEMDAMPSGRGMVEGTILADGTVLLNNGCQSGAQGFGLARDPAYQALYYDYTKAHGQRFTSGPTSTIARLYHSATLMLLDGTVLIMGSNPVEMPVNQPVYGKTPSEDYVTEWRLEVLTPPYLSGNNANKRPTNLKLSTTKLSPGGKLNLSFTAPAGSKKLTVNMVHGGFVTHSLHMNQRSVFLDSTGFAAGATNQNVVVTMPPNYNVVPKLPYVLYVLVDGVPAVGQFIFIQ